MTFSSLHLSVRAFCIRSCVRQSFRVFSMKRLSKKAANALVPLRTKNATTSVQEISIAIIAQEDSKREEYF